MPPMSNDAKGFMIFLIYVCAMALMIWIGSVMR
jgi:hypothetical protein